jgi:hypothetical protein
MECLGGLLEAQIVTVAEFHDVALARGRYRHSVQARRRAPGDGRLVMRGRLAAGGTSSILPSTPRNRSATSVPMRVTLSISALPDRSRPAPSALPGRAAPGAGRAPWLPHLIAQRRPAGQSEADGASSRQNWRPWPWRITQMGTRSRPDRLVDRHRNVASCRSTAVGIPLALIRPLNDENVVDENQCLALGVKWRMLSTDHPNDPKDIRSRIA